MSKDIILGAVEDDYDLMISNGDFVIAESDIQHMRHIIEADKGHFKQWPKLGVGIRKYLNSTIDGTLKREILINLRSDGYNPQQVKENDSAVVVRL